MERVEEIEQGRCLDARTNSDVSKEKASDTLATALDEQQQQQQQQQQRLNNKVREELRNMHVDGSTVTGCCGYVC